MPGKNESRHVVAFSPEPTSRLRLTSPADVRVLYEPLKFRIVVSLDEPRSVKEVAALLGDTPNHLYHHFRTLQKHGLIKVGDERRAGSNLERVFVRTAEQFELSGELARTTAPPTTQMGPLLREAFEELQRSSEALGTRAKERSALQAIDGVRARMTIEQVQKFSKELRALTSRYFRDSKDATEDGEEYSFFYYVTPAAPKASGKKTSAKRPRRGRS